MRFFKSIFSKEEKKPDYVELLNIRQHNGSPECVVNIFVDGCYYQTIWYKMADVLGWKYMPIKGADNIEFILPDRVSFVIPAMLESHSMALKAYGSINLPIKRNI